MCTHTHTHTHTFVPSVTNNMLNYLGKICGIMLGTNCSLSNLRAQFCKKDKQLEGSFEKLVAYKKRVSGKNMGNGLNIKSTFFAFF